MQIIQHLILASGLHASVYGMGEFMCGDPGKARACVRGAVTASGEIFDPEVPTAAIALPATVKMRPMWVYLKAAPGPYKCRKVKLNDKMNERWIGHRGFDLTPAAWTKLTGNHDYGMIKVQVCLNFN